MTLEDYERRAGVTETIEGPPTIAQRLRNVLRRIVSAIRGRKETP